ncbi:Dipeptidase 1 [Blattella germanica]|nr:Dipeptidase 1 [Blattella germanica]
MLMAAPRRWLAVLAVLLIAVGVGVGVPLALRSGSDNKTSLQQRLELATRLLHEVPLVDGHNDLPWNIRKFLHNRLRDFRFGEDLRKVVPWSNSPWSHTDLPRLRAGHVAAQFWAAYVPCESQFLDAVQLTLEQIDVIRRLTEKYHPSLILCTSVADIKAAHAQGRVCSLIGVEGGHSLASSLPVLRTLYSVGVRYLTLTSNCNTPCVVKEMNRLGMLVDLSHVAVHTMLAALEALKGGLVMINFYSQFLTCRNTATADDAVAHINHIRNVAGVDSVGLGAGYDGINLTPEGLEDVSTYPTLFAALIGTGQWSIDDLKKLAGLNFLRVMQEVEKVKTLALTQ